MVGAPLDQFVLEGEFGEVAQFVGLVFFRVTADYVEGFLLPLVNPESLEALLALGFVLSGDGIWSSGHDLVANVGFGSCSFDVGVDARKFVVVDSPLRVFSFLWVVGLFVGVSQVLGILFGVSQILDIFVPIVGPEIGQVAFELAVLLGFWRKLRFMAGSVELVSGGLEVIIRHVGQSVVETFVEIA